MSAQPNILLIISDDHGYADRSATGNAPDAHTPGLDRLAARSTEFTNAYVSAPICSPSRAGLIAGAYQKRWGAGWFGTSEFPPEDYRVLPEQLKNLGYRTGYFGKVHYGSEKPGDRACPDRHGFDESYYGLAGMQTGRLNYLHHGEAAEEKYGEASRYMAVLPMIENGTEVPLEGFLTDELAGRTRDFITESVENDGDAPFFAMLAFNAVHNFCWQLPEEELRARGLPAKSDWFPPGSELNESGEGYEEWYQEAISPNLEHGREYYLAQLELMDRQIGLTLDHLDELGVAENTIVIYLTDNGGSTCNYGNNAPLAGTKYTLWEGGIRVPFLVSWPGGGVPEGATNDSLTISLDILPSLVAAAGGEIPHTTDGTDLLKRARGEESGAGRTLHWDTEWQWAVRDGDWKLTWVEDKDGGWSDQIRTYEHADAGRGLRLFNLAQDPGESDNLVEADPEKAAELLDKQRGWLLEVAGPGARLPETKLEV